MFNCIMSSSRVRRTLADLNIHKLGKWVPTPISGLVMWLNCTTKICHGPFSLWPYFSMVKFPLSPLNNTQTQPCLLLTVIPCFLQPSGSWDQVQYFHPHKLGGYPQRKMCPFWLCWHGDHEGLKGEFETKKTHEFSKNSKKNPSSFEYL